MTAGQTGLIELFGFDSTGTGMTEAEVRTAYDLAVGFTLDVTYLDRPVGGRVITGFLGDTYLLDIAMSSIRTERTPALIARDRFDRININLGVSGRATGLAAGRRIVSDPGTIVISDIAQPASFIDEPGRRTIVLSVPRPVIAARLGDPRELHGIVIDAAASALLAAHMQALAQQLPGLSVSAGEQLSNVAADLLVVALNRQRPADNGSLTDRRAALAARARRVIEERLGASDLSPEWLMTRLNVSRSDLYSLFEHAGGVSRYIWRRRLEQARAALADPADARRVGEVAFSYGFSSDAHFSRAFRLQFGTTPSAARRQANAR